MYTAWWIFTNRQYLLDSLLCKIKSLALLPSLPLFIFVWQAYSISFCYITTLKSLMLYLKVEPKNWKSNDINICDLLFLVELMMTIVQFSCWYSFLFSWNFPMPFFLPPFWPFKHNFNFCYSPTWFTACHFPPGPPPWCPASPCSLGLLLTCHSGNVLLCIHWFSQIIPSSC